MATLYYGNNGIMDLKPGTLDALRRLPKAWDIVLNLRPVNGQTARELDAVVLTERALHVLEFKRRKAPITILSDSRWLCQGQEIRNGVRGGESPAEQVVNSDKAFQAALTGRLAKLRDLTLPWVVLEQVNAGNRMGDEGTPMAVREWHDVGWAKVIHGLDHLGTLLTRREAALPARITDADAAQFRRHFGAKPLGHLTVQGVAAVLDSQERLRNSRLKFTTLSRQLTVEAVTDDHGAFELQGLPMEPFEVTVPAYPELRVLPGPTFKARAELLVMHLFLVQPQVSEGRVRELLEGQMKGVQQDVDAVLALAQDAEGRVERLEAELGKTRDTVAALLAVPGLQDNEVMQGTINDLAAKVEHLERDRRQAEASCSLDAEQVRRDALEPLQLELAALSERVGAVERHLQDVEQVAGQAQVQAHQAYRKAEHLEFRVENVFETASSAQQTARRATEQARTAAQTAERSATTARQAQGHAARSEAEAARAAQEAAVSREAQQGLLDLERTKYLTEEERRARRAEALKLSAIVGAAGGIISMQPIPFADNVILTPMQIWLVVRIGQMYGQSMTQDAALKLLGTLGFGFAAQHATVALYKLIPGLTFGLGPFTVFGFTVLLGAVTALFYERGRTASKAERSAMLSGIKTLLRDRTFAQEVKDVGLEAFSIFKANGFKTRPEDFKTVVDTLNERAKPIGDRVERELFGKGAGDA